MLGGGFATRKVCGQLERIATMEDGSIEVTFSFPYRFIYPLREVERDIDLEISIAPAKKSRSLNQNALMWEIIGKIAEEQDGWRADKNEVYLQLLKDVGAKTYELDVIPEAKDALMRAGGFRGYRVLNSYQKEDGTWMEHIEVYVGTSKMNSTEMSKVIDRAMDWAEELGIETEYFRREII